MKDPMTFLIRFTEPVYFKIINPSTVVLSNEKVGVPLYTAGSEEIVDEKRLKELQNAGVKIQIQAKMPLSGLRAMLRVNKDHPNATPQELAALTKKEIDKVNLI